MASPVVQTTICRQQLIAVLSEPRAMVIIQDLPDSFPLKVHTKAAAAATRYGIIVTREQELTKLDELKERIEYRTRKIEILQQYIAWHAGEAQSALTEHQRLPHAELLENDKRESQLQKSLLKSEQYDLDLLQWLQNPGGC